jgi:hypothetical protein
MRSTDGENDSAPRRCSVVSEFGSAVNSGSPSSARFTLPLEPRNRNRSTPSVKDRSSAPFGVSFRNVCRASRLERTTSARSSSPSSRATPVTRSPSTRSDPTVVRHRISAPAARAALPMAFDTPPVPPRGMPHARNAPSISPM